MASRKTLLTPSWRSRLMNLRITSEYEKLGSYGPGGLMCAGY